MCRLILMQMPACVARSLMICQNLARLRNHTFFSLEELNRELRRLLAELNNKPFQELPGSRQSMFESIDRPALAPLSSAPYEFAEWKKAPVQIKPPRICSLSVVNIPCWHR